MIWFEQSEAIKYLNIAKYDFQRAYNHSVDLHKSKSSNDC